MRLLLLCASSVASLVERESLVERALTEWVSVGSACEVLTVGGLRGLYAREAIPAGSELLLVDEKFMITSERVAGHPHVIAAIEALDGAEINYPKSSLFTIFLLAERAAGDASAFAPYIASLPMSLAGSPYFWDDGSEEMRLLVGTSLPSKIAEARVDTRFDYALIVEKYPIFGELHSLADWEWAYACVSSRVFNVEIDGANTRALVPVADLFNHGRESTVTWFFDSTRRTFTIPSTRNIQKGSEIILSYGQKSNSDLLLHYGFTVDDNSDGQSLQVYNTLRLSLGDVRDMIPKTIWTRIKQQRLRLKGSTVLETTTWYSAEQTREVFSYLRFIHAEGVELDVVPEEIYRTTLADTPVSPLSIRNELSVLATLAVIAHNALELLSNSQTELETSKPNFNVANARLVVAGEIDVARYYLRLERDVSSIANAVEARELIDRFNGLNQTHEDAAVAHYLSAVVLELGDFTRVKETPRRGHFRAYEL